MFFEQITQGESTDMSITVSQFTTFSHDQLSESLETFFIGMRAQEVMPGCLVIHVVQHARFHTQFDDPWVHDPAFC
jgi:hypothetical protein